MGNDEGSVKSTETKQRVRERFLQARFFLGALLFHLAVFLIFATKVVFDAVQSRNHAFKPDTTLVLGAPGPRAPDVRPMTPPLTPGPIAPDARGAAPIETPKIPDVITSAMRDAPSGPAVALARDVGPLHGPGDGMASPSARELGKRTDEQWDAVRISRDKWFPGAKKQLGYGNAVADFTVYLGRPVRGGDALAFVRFAGDGAEIVGGSIPNLAEMLNRFSKGRIKARVQGHVLRLDSPEVLETRPPFIYLTGRSDFRLTDEEITNLRKYLLVGGCIWGDNALPGHRSRFDIAFRREMKRVIPDDDKPFERLPEDHPIYGNGGFRLKEMPAGLNFAQWPVEAIRLDGIEAIIYTANGYGAMWQVTFDDSLRQIDNAVMQRNEKEFWEYRKIFYRNLNEDSLLRSYRLGYNIVLHLLLRYEAKLRTLPET
ncbi:MAG: DUF4159 domain-containing protein [Verrucomicrobiae bacterium]|nr:DUF4159 domain-containing protein [Verrucomicrobiae bacterium]